MLRPWNDSAGFAQCPSPCSGPRVRSMLSEISTVFNKNIGNVLCLGERLHDKLEDVNVRDCRSKLCGQESCWKGKLLKSGHPMGEHGHRASQEESLKL
jgi:hypothetical protein